MTLQYFGRNLEEGRKYPEAQIWYNEYSEESNKIADKMGELLFNMGWKEIYGEEGLLCTPLYFGMEDFYDFKEDYKKVKKMLNVKKGM